MAAPGPSLVPVTGHPIIAVQDAWRVVPWADCMYGCDGAWWNHHQGVPEYQGERWSTHESQIQNGREVSTNNKQQVHESFGVKCVQGRRRFTFSLDPSVIHYGDNSGFQAVNLAILFGCTTIVLVGFDMNNTGGRMHFFGDHPDGLRTKPNFGGFIKAFNDAQKELPSHIQIINATPNSALNCFPKMELSDAVELLDRAAQGSVNATRDVSRRAV